MMKKEPNLTHLIQDNHNVLKTSGENLSNKLGEATWQNLKGNSRGSLLPCFMMVTRTEGKNLFGFSLAFLLYLSSGAYRQKYKLYLLPISLAKLEM